MKDLSDSRQKGKRKYKIWDIVVVTFLAVLGNCNSWEEIKIFAESKKTWLKSFLKLSKIFLEIIGWYSISYYL